MSLETCIPDLLEQGKLTPEQAERAQAIYGRRKRHHERRMGKAAAAALASEEAVTAIERAAKLKMRQTLLQVKAQKDALTGMLGYAGGRPDGGIDPRAAEALIDRDSKARYSNVEGRRKAIKGRAHATIDRVLADHRRTLTGKLRNPAQMRDIVRELFGEDSGSLAAKELADAWAQASEMLRQRFNAAGGAIGKLDRWGLPQSHDSRAVRAAGWTEWRDTILPLLDRERMVDGATGQRLDDTELEAALRDVFETIRTDGWAGRSPGGRGVGKTANRRQEHRFLHFRDAAGWEAYQARFGAGTAFDAMMGHIEALSRDIAAMEVLGPNPTATIKWLQDTIQKDAALHGDDGGRAGDRAFASSKRVQRLWDEYTGALRRPESRAIALGFSTLRSIQTAAKLGSAVLSAVSDIGFQVSTRKFNGLPAAGVIRDYAKLLNPASAEDRKLAVRRGLIAEEWANMTAAQNRYLVEELTGEVASRLADGTLRASGLAAWTQAGRWAFGMEFLDTLAGQFGKTLGDIDPALRAVLERHGFDDAAWEAIRKTPLRRERGEDWFFPQDVEDPRLGDRILEMVQGETDFAVPVADLRTRAIMNSGAPPGTIPGEIARSAFLFKSFGISVIVLHGRRALEQAEWQKAAYAAGLTIALTLGGALALQLKEIAKGKDPRPMETPEYWGAAMLQGGGFGIFGDFLNSSESRFGGGLAETAMGPLIQTAQNVGDMTVGNAFKAARGDDTDVGRDFARLLRQEVPIASSLWYTRLAYDRLVADQIEALVNPDFRSARRRLERRAERDYGQGYWWRPGELTPERPPEPGEAPR